MFSISEKNAVGILIGLALNLKIVLDTVDILTFILNFLSHKCNVSHSFVSSLIPLSNILVFRVLTLYFDPSSDMPFFYVLTYLFY